MEKYQKRSDVPEKYKWDLTDLVANDLEFNNSLAECNDKLKKINSFIGCTKDAKKLYDFLEFNINLVAVIENLEVYAFLKNDEELGVQENIVRKNKADVLAAQYSSLTSFFVPELLELSLEEYNNLFKENVKLNEYKADLDDLYRTKEHTLSGKEEAICSELVNAMNHYDDMSSNLLNNEHNYGKIKIDNEIIEIATNNYGKLLRNKNRDIRRKVYNSFNKRLSEYAGTSANLLNSYVSMNNSLAKIHNFKNSWEEKLFNLKLNNKVFTSLIKACENNLEPIHKYFNLRKDILKLDTQHVYDLRLELANDNYEYTIEEAQNLVRSSLEVLGSDYVKRYNRIIDNKYIDYCQYKGKCSGGYSASSISKEPRILFSFTGNLSSVSTIAHECGHHINHQYMLENCPLQYASNTNLVAEVASLTNECLLSSYLSSHGKSKEEKLAGVANIIDVIISNFYGAVREGTIEIDMYKEVNKGNAITKEFMNKKVKKSLKKYYGDAVKLDKYSVNSWITRSHYFMHFYLFSYAICISVAINVAEKILNGDKDMLNKYKQFLKTGSDVSPIDTFKILDIDLEDEKVYVNTANYLDKLLTTYDKIYNEGVGSNE